MNADPYELAASLPSRNRGVIAVASATSSNEATIATAPSDLPPHAMFEAGSLTKTLTATLLAVMVGHGVVRLDSTVGELLGQDAGTTSDVSLLELATHTSGLPRLAPNAMRFPFWPRDPYRFYGRKRLLNGLAGVALKDRGAPSYSGLGFDLLGVCLSVAADKALNKLLREEVFVPAGMESARCQPCRKKGLIRGHGPLLTGGRRWHQPLAGAGGVDCSIQDLARWLEVNVAPQDDRLGEAIRLCQTPHAPTSTGNIGLAWQLTDGVIWHNGATGAFQSVVAFVPQAGGAATLSNLGLSNEIQHDKPTIEWVKKRFS